MLAKEVFVYVPGNRGRWHQILEHQPKAADLPKGVTVKSWIAKRREDFLAKYGPGPKDPKVGWLKFGFPLHYNSDVLEAMVALAMAGTPYSPPLEKPLKAIREKQTGDGKWILESSLNGKMLVDVEAKGKPSKWLTWMALYVL